MVHSQCKLTQHKGMIFYHCQAKFYVLFPHWGGQAQVHCGSLSPPRQRFSPAFICTVLYTQLNLSLNVTAEKENAQNKHGLVESGEEMSLINWIENNQIKPGPSWRGCFRRILQENYSIQTTWWIISITFQSQSRANRPFEMIRTRGSFASS